MASTRSRQSPKHGGRIDLLLAGREFAFGDQVSACIEQRDRKGRLVYTSLRNQIGLAGEMCKTPDEFQLKLLELEGKKLCFVL